MNNRLLSRIALLLACSALVCCKQDPKPTPDPDPVFPQAKEVSMASGQSAVISFQANLDWEVRIPSESVAYFYFDDAGIKAYQIRGKAGEASITVCTETLSGIYDAQTCTIEISMGGSRQTLASVRMEGIYADLAIYQAERDAQGAFIYSPSGDISYEETPAAALSLTWPRGLSAYNLPVKIVSNADWAVSDNHPQWLTVSKTEGKSGETLMNIVGNPYFYPLDTEHGSIEFVDIHSHSTICNVPISIDGCKDIIFINMDHGNMDFNIFGEYYSNGTWTAAGCPIYLTSTLDAEIIAAGGADWIQVVCETPGGEQNGKIIQDRFFHIKAEANSGAPRTAVMLAVPGYIAKDLDRSNISRDIIEKYQFAQVSQVGIDPSMGWSVISPVNDAYTMAVYGAGLSRTPSDDPDYESLFQTYSTDEIYTLTYNNWYSSEKAFLASTKSFESCSFIDYYSSSEWNYSDFISIVYPEADNHNMFFFDISYFEEGAQTIAILRDTESEVVAVIICRMSENYWPKVEYTDIHFCNLDFADPETDPDGEFLPHGAILEELTSGNLYNRYADHGIPVYRLRYESEESMKNAMFYVPPFPVNSESSVEIIPANSWLKVERGTNEKEKVYIHVSMSREDPGTGKNGEVIIRGGGRPLFALECVREFLK